MRATKFGLTSLLTGIPSSLVHTLKRNRPLRKVSVSAVGLAAVLLLLVPILAVTPSAEAAAPTLGGGGVPKPTPVGPVSSLGQVGQQAVPAGPLQFLGMPGPEVQAQGTYHWYAGAEWPPSAPTYTATSVSMVMTTPSTQPNPNVRIYACESTFDNVGSYDQMGICDNYGTCYAFYSWTTGPTNNLSYHYDPSWHALALNTSYWFNMEIDPSGAVFYLWQYIGGGLYALVDSYATNDAATLMYLQYSYQGDYCYTDYEEIWSPSQSYVPEDNFFFKDNEVVVNGSSYYQDLWDQMTPASPPPALVVVQKSYADVNIDNSPTNPAVPTLSLTYPSSVVVGQPITITLSAANTAGYTATQMHLQLEFPSLTSASQVTVNASPPFGTVFGAGAAATGDYGYWAFTTSYDLANYYDTNVPAGGTVADLQVTLPGQNYGTFTFYATALVGLDFGNPYGWGWMHDPDGFAPGTRQDQKGEWVRKYTITIQDVIPPTTTISLNPTNPQCSSGWYNTPVTVTLSAQDDPGGSGVNYTVYSLNGGTTWNVYGAPFTVTAQGTTTVLYKSVDKAGNWEATKSRSFKIDTALPMTTITGSGTQGCNGWYISPVTVTLQGADPNGSNGSGVNYLQYSVNGSGWANVPNSYTFTLSNTGCYTLQARAVDNACNTGNPATAQFNVDVTPLQVTMVAPANGDSIHGVYTFAAKITDETFGGAYPCAGVHPPSQVRFWLRVNNGAPLGGTTGYDMLPMNYNSATGNWEITLNTDASNLPDGCYMAWVGAWDYACLGSQSQPVYFYIHNWAVTQMGSLPMPPAPGVLGNYMFSVNVAPSVDPTRPKVLRNDFTIKIFATSNPGNILQTYTYVGIPSTTGYWIDPLGVYHVEFQGSTRPMQYTIAVYSSCGSLIGQYNFSTKGMFGF